MRLPWGNGDFPGPLRPGHGGEMALICIMNGPNLNLLGQRQPEIYGRETLADVEAACAGLAGAAGHRIEMFQSNHEGALIDKVQALRGVAAAIVLNAGAYSHSSVALLDALNAYEGIVIEVHISNIHRREAFRHQSYPSLRAEGIILGCGIQGYEMGVARVIRLLG
jgi:3-dehydroquinate dehydratase-2